MNPLCQQFQEEMGAYVYETPPQELTQHLAMCETCQKNFQDFEQLKMELKTISLSPSIESIEALQNQLRQELDWKKSMEARPRIPWFSMLAASLFFGLGFWLGEQKTNPLPEKSSYEKQISTTPTLSSSLNEMLPLSHKWLTIKGLQYIHSGTQSLKKN